jgi:hypothetical protein
MKVKAIALFCAVGIASAWSLAGIASDQKVGQIVRPVVLDGMLDPVAAPRMVVEVTRFDPPTKGDMKFVVIVKDGAKSVPIGGFTISSGAVGTVSSDRPLTFSLETRRAMDALVWPVSPANKPTWEAAVMLAPSSTSRDGPTTAAMIDVERVTLTANRR